MKKVIIYSLIFAILLLGARHLQKKDNRAIMNKASGVADSGLSGYFIDSGVDYLRYSEESGAENRVVIDKDTKFLRLFVDTKEILLQQENITVNDFIKDQFIEIDVYRGGASEWPRALIIRQKVYVED